MEERISFRVGTGTKEPSSLMLSSLMGQIYSVRTENSNLHHGVGSLSDVIDKIQL